METLTEPDKNLSDAVKVRQEIDLRIGASFTRFQTLLLQNYLGSAGKQLLSYGPCQFPTLGFIVERYQQIKDFKPESFWSIKFKVKRRDVDGKLKQCEFNWKRDRLYDQAAVIALKEACEEAEFAKVKSMAKK